MPEPTRDQVFISCSHKDTNWRKNLETLLSRICETVRSLAGRTNRLLLAQSVSEKSRQRLPSQRLLSCWLPLTSSPLTSIHDTAYAGHTSGLTDLSYKFALVSEDANASIWAHELGHFLRGAPGASGVEGGLMVSGGEGEKIPVRLLTDKFRADFLESCNVPN
jgi:hypothetical protein